MYCLQQISNGTIVRLCEVIETCSVIGQIPIIHETKEEIEEMLKEMLEWDNFDTTDYEIVPLSQSELGN